MNRRFRRALAATLAVTGVWIGSVLPSSAEIPEGIDLPEARPGQAGTITALPVTDSAKTVRGGEGGSFADLEVTVNQTEDLGNQTISITWEGGEPTVRENNVDFGQNFLQIMQCWSEPGAGGPDPQQCQFGATDAVPGGRNGSLYSTSSLADERIFSDSGFETFDEEAGAFDERTGRLWMPFRPVGGDEDDEIGIHVDPDFSPAVESGEYWLNPSFNVITTNEIPGGKTRSDGTGEELFEVQTGQEASGLGCGQKVLGEGAERLVPDCWLVIVPRGTGAQENVGTIPGDPIWGDNPAVMTSPLGPTAWANRILVKLEFNPVDSPCDIDAEQRRVVGSELVLRAIRSWQPALCRTPGLPPYGYTTAPDSAARRQLLEHLPGAPGMAVTSGPIPPSQLAEGDAIVFAPLTLSSMVVAFNIERVPDAVVGAAEEELRGVRVADLNLTPRLVAKLLTQSYQSQVYIANREPGTDGEDEGEDHEDPEDYQWAAENPRQLQEDPDFLFFNPEFQLLHMDIPKTFGGMVLPLGSSDAAADVWSWIFADPEASAWLAGEPDEYGMVVNPAYATTDEGNSSGVAFGDPLPETFPKSEPNCYQAPPQGKADSIIPNPLCGTDWFPYASSFREAGQRARSANDGARTTHNPDAVSAAGVWRANGPQLLGKRSILAMVDSATAAQYGLQVARLSRPGDDGDDRRFIAPDQAGVLAGLDAMVPSEDVEGFLVPDPGADAPDAYPLTVLNYAAVTPLHLDERARQEYADFIDYAVGDGQEPGLELGQLPPGYAQLPDELRDQARAGAEVIRTIQAPGASTTTTTAPPSTTTTAPAPSTTRAAGGRMPTTAPPTTAPPTTVAPVVATGGDRPASTTTSTTEPPVPGMTPASAIGGIRFALPVLAGIALLAMLLILEITKRPRRALAGKTTSAVVLVVASSVLGATLLATAAGPAGAQDDQSDAPVEVEALDLGLVTAPDGDAITGGPSTTAFAVDLAGPDECPGDSEHDDFRVFSFMVPSSLAAEDIEWNGEGPAPRAFETYEDLRLPLFDTDTNEVTAGFTAPWETEDGPGRIPELPTFSFGLFTPGELPVGSYRIGIACVLRNELFRYWDTEIDVVAAEDDPAGFEWSVVGVAAGDDDSGGSDTSPVLFIAAGVVVLAALVLLIVRRRPPAAQPAREHA